MTESATFIARTKLALRRATRFDVRFMLMLTTIAALGVLWWEDRQRLEKRIAAMEARFMPTRFVGNSWSEDQATGPPDTLTAGDRPTAWASQTQDGQLEWLELHYARAVKPFQIDVYETYNPGAVTKVTAFDQFGTEKVLWQGVDPTSPSAGMGVSSFDVKNGFSTDRVRIYLASDKFPGWNEIDAVGLRYGWFGQILWAEKAKASSTYSARAYFGKIPL